MWKRVGCLVKQTHAQSGGENKRSLESSSPCSVFHICRRTGFSFESNLPYYICNKLLGLIPVVRKIMGFVAKHIFSLVTNQWGETYVTGTALLDCPFWRPAEDIVLLDREFSIFSGTRFPSKSPVFFVCIVQGSKCCSSWRSLSLRGDSILWCLKIIL